MTWQGWQLVIALPAGAMACHCCPSALEEGLTCSLSGTQLVPLHFCTQFGFAREMPRDKEGIASGKSSQK